MAAPRGSLTSRGTIRWRATPEQLRILEGLFKGGIKSPSAQELQRITAKLKEHGKVESKNVFYWFQNHKAREKQKLRSKFHTHKDLVYYNFQPNPLPQFACGFWPMFPAQVMTGQWVTSAAPDLVTGINSNEERQEDSTISTPNNKSSWVVTWLPSDSDHHRRPLETLQLFPTTTETTTTATTSSTSATSSMFS